MMFLCVYSEYFVLLAKIGRNLQCAINFINTSGGIRKIYVCGVVKEKLHEIVAQLDVYSLSANLII